MSCYPRFNRRSFLRKSALCTGAVLASSLDPRPGLAGALWTISSLGWIGVPVSSTRLPRRESTTSTPMTL